MNKKERNVTAWIVIILFSALVSLIMNSCQIELENTCEDHNEYWTLKMEEELDEMYASCPDKCDFSEERSAIIKKYKSKFKNCE